METRSCCCLQTDLDVSHMKMAIFWGDPAFHVLTIMKKLVKPLKFFPCLRSHPSGLLCVPAEHSQ